MAKSSVEEIERVTSALFVPKVIENRVYREALNKLRGRNDATIDEGIAFGKCLKRKMQAEDS